MGIGSRRSGRTSPSSGLGAGDRARRAIRITFAQALQAGASRSHEAQAARCRDSARRTRTLDPAAVAPAGNQHGSARLDRRIVTGDAARATRCFWKLQGGCGWTCDDDERSTPHRGRVAPFIRDGRIGRPSARPGQHGSRVGVVGVVIACFWPVSGILRAAGGFAGCPESPLHGRRARSNDALGLSWSRRCRLDSPPCLRTALARSGRDRPLRVRARRDTCADGREGEAAGQRAAR